MFIGIVSINLNSEFRYDDNEIVKQGIQPQNPLMVA